MMTEKVFPWTKPLEDVVSMPNGVQAVRLVRHGSDVWLEVDDAVHV
jgi:hypothetical protein